MQKGTLSRESLVNVHIKKQPRIARQQEVVDAQNYKAFTLAARLDFLRAAVFL